MIRIHQLSDGCHRQILAKMAIGTKSLPIFLLDRRRHSQHSGRLIHNLNTVFEPDVQRCFHSFTRGAKHSGTVSLFSFGLSASPQMHKEWYIFRLRDIISRFESRLNKSSLCVFLWLQYCKHEIKNRNIHLTRARQISVQTHKILCQK